ncbi:hypothetical protein NCCP2050_02180 [Planococcus sp. NCCP-2050]|nr:hypothetical protein NCCP2050_02180 [Planococcus sp. NCCP-2050]
MLGGKKKWKYKRAVPHYIAHEIVECLNNIKLKNRKTYLE